MLRAALPENAVADARTVTKRLQTPVRPNIGAYRQRSKCHPRKRVRVAGGTRSSQAVGTGPVLIKPAAGPKAPEAVTGNRPGSSDPKAVTRNQ